MEELKEKILGMFFEEPEREFYVRELAKSLKKSPTTISKYLNQLDKEGLLVSSNKFGHLFFKANASKKFNEFKIHHNIKKIRDSGIVEYFNEKFDPSAIVLFGSFAKGKNIKRSDIDFLIISPSKREIDVKKYENKLGHEIQIFVHSKDSLKKMKNKDLVNNFINGIVLEGHMEVI